MLVRTENFMDLSPEEKERLRNEAAAEASHMWRRLEPAPTAVDPDLVLKWVTALESGEFAQTKQVLHDRDGGYCCLGVLAHIYALDHADEYGWEDDYDSNTFRRIKALVRRVGHDVVRRFRMGLPETLAARAGLSTPHGAPPAGMEKWDIDMIDSWQPHWADAPPVRRYESLSNANDEGVSFREIAYAIRKANKLPLPDLPQPRKETSRHDEPPF